MPHCVLEYSQNIVDQLNYREFFQRLHALLSASGEIQLDQLKSRIRRVDEYYIGDGSPKNAFVYLQISLLSGRSQAVREEFGAQAFELLTSCFPRSQKELSCSITLEMREMERSTHFKITKKV